MNLNHCNFKVSIEASGFDKFIQPPVILNIEMAVMFDKLKLSNTFATL